jgi:MFS family permease
MNRPKAATPAQLSPMPMCTTTLWRSRRSAAALLAMLFGSLIFGAVTDTFGRQKVYVADLACFVALSALQFIATEPWQLIVVRSLMSRKLHPATVMTGPGQPERLRAADSAPSASARQAR